MESMLISPAKFIFFGFLPGWVLSLSLLIIGLGVFTYIIWKRILPIKNASPDNSRLDRIPERIVKLAKLWFLQARHPRYPFVGILHILIFFGFLILSVRTGSLSVIGIFENFELPGLAYNQPLGQVYNIIKDYTATIVFFTCLIAAVRRSLFKPARYNVPEKYGHDHTLEAVFVLAIIMGLMISESIFEAAAASAGNDGHTPQLTLVWMFSEILNGSSHGMLQKTHLVSYFFHDALFFFFLCFLPMGKHFHVITSVFNVFFMRIDKGNIKPVVYGVNDEGLDDLESFGVKKIEDFTWKHMLDFYSCADCGRCSDHCPANAAGRPLSPRFISIKCRDFLFRKYPVIGKPSNNRELIGSVLEKDEIWSCTTCGACEEECPLLIEYIDKIVDVRRGFVDDGNVPQSLQKPLGALEKRGNPWGKMEKKRADWAKDEDFSKDYTVKILGRKESADTLYFVDSISSYDDRMQDIARATARLLSDSGIDYGILGKLEKDSGHEVRRFGEEMLFQDLKDNNTEAILNSGVKNIVTADPHAYNALKNDYANLPPVVHISEVIERKVKTGDIRLKEIEDKSRVYTFHDPCYLGRHNELYAPPRAVIDAVPGIKRIDMKKSGDRSFCCGGGGLMLFYEPEEEQRMGVLRVGMAKEAGANVIVTACPFCLVNIEDAIKVAGMEGEMNAIDLTELIDRHVIRE